MLDSFFNKDAGLKACSSIKKRLQHNCFPVKFAKNFRTRFFKEFQWLLLSFQLMFSKEFGAKAGATVRNKYQIQLKKKQLLRKSRSSHPRCSVNVAKFLRTPIFKIICERVLLKISTSAASLPNGGNS